MIVTGTHLPRRTVLRGLGAAVALPLLDAMVPATAAAARRVNQVPNRLATLYVPMGMSMARWTPPSEGALELSPTLGPLSAFKDRLAVLSGLDTPAAANDNGFHPRDQTAWATGVCPRRSDTDIEAGVSMDQIAAKEFARDTQLPSLELALEGVDTLNAGCARFGYNCVYLGTIAWRTANTPLPMEVNPRAVFERLFGASGTTDGRARAADLRRDRSLLDAITGGLGDLQKQVGAGDRRIVANYFDSVRDVERRIQIAERQVERELPIMEKPAGIPAAYADHARLMFDLLVLAFQTDLTRVSTFLYAREASVRGWPEIGVPDSWHPLSHHANDPEKLERLAKINTFHTGLFAYLLERLQATPDGDGSLLDHTTLLFGSGMSDSDDHTPVNVPTMVAGPRIKGGRHINYGRGTPTTSGSAPTQGRGDYTGVPFANLQRTLLEMVGVPVERFGNGPDKVGFLSL